jgi:alkaline phosphatase
MKKLCYTQAIMAFLALSLSITANAAGKPKNVIMVIGDGMGPSYTSAYRYFMDNRATAKVESTIFDQLLVGMSSTYSSGTQEDHTTNTYVTDSAAAATALSTGVKTYNQAVALDVNDKPLQTIMEYAKSIGKTTGLVVTSQINHATPASYVAHNTFRYNYNAIADNYFDNRVNGQLVADLMFGGGQKYFIRKDRNIVEQFKKAGYQYFDRFDQLESFNRLPALGLFAKSGIGFAIDSNPKFRLRSMVTKALKLMNNNDKGFFLLVEGSLIDWCGHDNDIGCAMNEMDDLAKTAEYLKDYVDANPDTLLVMTADHGTGGLSIGKDGHYLWKAQQIRKITHSINFAAKQLISHESVKTAWQQNINIPISDIQLDKLSDKVKQAKALANVPNNLGSPELKKIKAKAHKARKSLENTMAAILAENTLTGWTSLNHTGGDVQVFAHGHSKAQFIGHQDNTDIAKKLFKLIH